MNIGEKIGFKLIPYWFNKNGTKFELINVKQMTRYIEELSKPITDFRKLKAYFGAWALMSGRIHEDLILDSYNKKEEYMYCLKNMFCCEAHAELMQHYYNLKCNNIEELYEEHKKTIKYYMNFERNFIYKEDDELNRDVVLWGCCDKSEKRSKEFKQCVFVDKNEIKQGLYFCGKKVVSPEIAIKEYGNATFFICTRKERREEIQEYLINNGIGLNRIKYVD